MAVVHRALALLAVSASLAVAARPAAAGEVVVEARATDGTGDDDALRLGLLAVGVRWRVAPTLDVHAVALGLATFGVDSIGEPAAGGGGGEVGAQLVPWPRATVRPTLGVSVGLLGFPRRPFLPGGDIYEAVITFSAGADTALGAGWSAGARAFMIHLSNGQGLGPFNPAYDGYGVGLSVARALGDRSSTGAMAPAPTIAPPRGPRLAVVTDAEVGAADGAMLVAARLRPSVRLTRWADALLDVEAGTLAGAPSVESGLALIGHGGPVTAAAQGGYRRYGGVDIAVLTLQAEVRLTAEATVVAMGHHERSAGFGRVWRAGAGLRLQPTAALAVELGVGFDRLGDHTVFGDDHADPYLGAAWRTPWRLGRQALTLFLERQVSTADVVGVRLEAPTGPGWRRLR